MALEKAPEKWGAASASRLEARLVAVFARYFRIPWTAFGWRYDLNSRKWRGPDTGDVFDPGAVIYD